MSQSPVHAYFNTTNNYLHRSFGVRIRAEMVKALIGAPVNKQLLDAGCGDGGVSLQFVAGNRVVFLDISENMLDLVRSKISESDKPDVEFVLGDLENVNLDRKA